MPVFTWSAIQVACEQNVSEIGYQKIFLLVLFIGDASKYRGHLETCQYL